MGCHSCLHWSLVLAIHYFLMLHHCHHQTGNVTCHKFQHALSMWILYPDCVSLFVPGQCHLARQGHNINSFHSNLQILYECSRLVGTEVANMSSLGKMLYQYMAFIMGQLFCTAIHITHLNKSISRWFVCTAWPEPDVSFIHKPSELLTAESSVIIGQNLHWGTMLKKHWLQLCVQCLDKLVAARLKTCGGPQLIRVRKWQSL